MFYFKILANCIVYIRACRRGSYTNLYLRECVMWVNVPPVVVYVCKNRLRCSSFTWTQKGKKGTAWSTDSFTALLGRSDFYDRSRVVLQEEPNRAWRQSQRHLVLPKTEEKSRDNCRSCLISGSIVLRTRMFSWRDVQCTGNVPRLKSVVRSFSLAQSKKKIRHSSLYFGSTIPPNGSKSSRAK